MKNYILTFMLLAIVVSCGPTETQENEMRDLVAEWKNTSVKAVELSEQIGDKLYLLQSKKNEEGSPDMITINLDGNETDCETQYEEMQTRLETFLETWKVSSEQVDDLTNSMAVGKWTARDQDDLERLDLELKQREVEIAQWENEIEEINKKCDLTSETLVIQEKDS